MILALIGFAFVFAVALIGIPLGFSMILVGTSLFAWVRGWNAALTMAGQTIINLAQNDAFSVVPLFILMGTFVYKANLAEELYDTAYAWIGHIKGGLAHATIIASAGFAAMCGSSIATTATMTKVSMPSMRRLGYADSLATGSVACGGTLGTLLPPSVPLLVYGILTGQDISKLFIAGIGPGILTAALFLFVVGCTVHWVPEKGPAGHRTKWPERFRALWRTWGIAVLFVLVIGGLYADIFTASEAGGVGSFGSFVFALMRGRLSVKTTFEALVEAGMTATMILLITFGGLIFANFIALSGLTDSLVQLVRSVHFPATGIIILIGLIYIVLGSFLDGLAMMFLTVPVFTAIVQPLGVNLIWFGVFVVVIIEIGLIHPPLGMNIFVVKTLLPEVPLRTIYLGALPFLVANLLMLSSIIAFPSIVLYLVQMMHAR